MLILFLDKINIETFLLYFSAESWYTPIFINLEADFTDIEKSKIALINQDIATDVYKEMKAN